MQHQTSSHPASEALGDGSSTAFSEPTRKAIQAICLQKGWCAGEKQTPLKMDELQILLLYLQKTRGRAERIRENSAAGSYLHAALSNTIAGLDAEIGQLRHVLALGDGCDAELSAALPTTAMTRPRRMRKAL